MSEEFEKIVMKRFDKMDQRFDKMDQRFNKMEQRFNKMDQRFDKMDQRFDKMDQKIDNVNAELNQKIDNVNAELGQKIDNVKKELTEKINDLSGNVAVLEYKVATELPAIYEAHTLNYEIQKRNEEKLNSLLETTSKNSIHITHLYEIVRNHEEQLRKLTSC